MFKGSAGIYVHLWLINPRARYSKGGERTKKKKRKGRRKNNNNRNRSEEQRERDRRKKTSNNQSISNSSICSRQEGDGYQYKNNKMQIMVLIDRD